MIPKQVVKLALPNQISVKLDDRGVYIISKVYMRGLSMVHFLTVENTTEEAITVLKELNNKINASKSLLTN